MPMYALQDQTHMYLASRIPGADRHTLIVTDIVLDTLLAHWNRTPDITIPAVVDQLVIDLGAADVTDATYLKAVIRLFVTNLLAPESPGIVTSVLRTIFSDTPDTPKREWLTSVLDRAAHDITYTGPGVLDDLTCLTPQMVEDGERRTAQHAALNELAREACPDTGNPAAGEVGTVDVRGDDLDAPYVLVGEAGGLSAVYESAPSTIAPGLRAVQTEHGMLLLDPEGLYAVLA